MTVVSDSSNGRPRGTLVAIGGGDYEQAEPIDRYMLDLLQDRDAPVAFLPTARTSRKVGERFVEYYRALGARNVFVVPVYEREDAFAEENVEALLAARLIFIGWGRNTRLVEILHRTPVQEALARAYAQGAVLACMSAGARVAGSLSIAHGTGLEALRLGIDEGPIREAQDGPVQLQPGFNLVPGLVFEPHFGEWNRYGHFLLLAALRPELTWVGIDERTAIVIHSDDRIEIIGSGNVYVSRRHPPVKVVPPRNDRPLEAWDVRLDILAHGSTTTLTELRRPRGSCGTGDLGAAST